MSTGDPLEEFYWRECYKSIFGNRKNYYRFWALMRQKEVNTYFKLLRLGIYIYS